MCEGGCALPDSTRCAKRTLCKWAARSEPDRRYVCNRIGLTSTRSATPRILSQCQSALSGRASEKFSARARSMCMTTLVDGSVKSSQLETAARAYQTGTYAASGTESSKTAGCEGGDLTDGPPVAALALAFALCRAQNRGWRRQHDGVAHDIVLFYRPFQRKSWCGGWCGLHLS